MGFEICYFRHLNELTEHRKEDIVISYVNDVKTVLYRHSIVMSELEDPEELTAYLGRRVWKSQTERGGEPPGIWLASAHTMKIRRYGVRISDAFWRNGGVLSGTEKYWMFADIRETGESISIIRSLRHWWIRSNPPPMAMLWTSD